MPIISRSSGGYNNTVLEIHNDTKKYNNTMNNLTTPKWL